MTDETTSGKMGYTQTKEQLDEIVKEVRRKDVSLEKSLELLEEGVQLANRCTELIDQAAWEDVAVENEDTAEEETSTEESAEESEEEAEAVS